MIRQWLLNAIRKEGYTAGEINIILCSDEYLHKLNVQYLAHDTYTDIITFDNSAGKTITGELYISIDRIRENAFTLKHTIVDELHRVIIHGVLHLCGYTDKSRAAKNRMTAREDYHLKRLQQLTTAP